MQSSSIAPLSEIEAIHLISKRYGLTFESALAATKDLKLDALIKLAEKQDNEFLKSVLLSTEPIHTLPDAATSFTDEELIDQDTILWFVDCSAETFEFHCVNNKDQLLNTLLFRKKFLADYLENDGGCGRMCDLFMERRRYDLMEITSTHFPHIQFPN
jgi:hypothetical protein